MKFNFIMIILVLILTLQKRNVVAQGKVDVSSIVVMKTNDYSRGLSLGDPISKATEIFGNPTSISTELSEMTGKQMTLYKYGTYVVLYFLDDKFYRFNCNVGGNFTVGKINGPALNGVSSSISGLGLTLTNIKQEGIDATTPVPGGGSPVRFLMYDAGDVYSGDIEQDCYFAITHVLQGEIRGFGVYSK